MPWMVYIHFVASLPIAIDSTYKLTPPAKARPREGSPVSCARRRRSLVSCKERPTNKQSTRVIILWYNSIGQRAQTPHGGYKTTTVVPGGGMRSRIGYYHLSLMVKAKLSVIDSDDYRGEGKERRSLLIAGNLRR